MICPRPGADPCTDSTLCWACPHTEAPDPAPWKTVLQVVLLATGCACSAGLVVLVLGLFGMAVLDVLGVIR